MFTVVPITNLSCVNTLKRRRENSLDFLTFLRHFQEISGWHISFLLFSFLLKFSRKLNGANNKQVDKTCVVSGKILRNIWSCHIHLALCHTSPLLIIINSRYTRAVMFLFLLFLAIYFIARDISGRGIII